MHVERAQFNERCEQLRACLCWAATGPCICCVHLYFLFRVNYFIETFMMMNTTINIEMFAVVCSLSTFRCCRWWAMLLWLLDFLADEFVFIRKFMIFLFLILYSLRYLSWFLFSSFVPNVSTYFCKKVCSKHVFLDSKEKLTEKKRRMNVIKIWNKRK